MTSTLLYFNQASIVSQSFTSRGAQTTFFATIDLTVNVLTLVIQVFLTGRIVRWLGVGMALALAAGAEHDRLRCDRAVADAGGGGVIPGAAAGR